MAFFFLAIFVCFPTHFSELLVGCEKLSGTPAVLLYIQLEYASKQEISQFLVIYYVNKLVEFVD
jgi:hypothetical protein